MHSNYYYCFLAANRAFTTVGNLLSDERCYRQWFEWFYGGLWVRPQHGGDYTETAEIVGKSFHYHFDCLFVEGIDE